MELKNITELETQYPTEQQIDKKELRKNIPTKWTKLGLTAFIFNLMMSGKVLAEKNFFANVNVMGEMPVEIEVIPRTVLFVERTLHILPIIMAIITIIQAIKYKISKKKNIDEEQLKKSKKRTFIFTVITVVLIIIDIFFVGIGKELLIELL